MQRVAYPQIECDDDVVRRIGLNARWWKANQISVLFEEDGVIVWSVRRVLQRFRGKKPRVWHCYYAQATSPEKKEAFKTFARCMAGDTEGFTMGRYGLPDDVLGSVFDFVPLTYMNSGGDEDDACVIGFDTEQMCGFPFSISEFPHIASKYAVRTGNEALAVKMGLALLDILKKDDIMGFVADMREGPIDEEEEEEESVTKRRWNNAYERPAKRRKLQ